MTKDTVSPAECDDGHKDCLALDPFQVGLGQEPHAQRVSVLGEHYGIFAQTHGAGLEAVAVVTNRLVAIDLHLLTVPKTGNNQHTAGVSVKLSLHN